MSIQQVLLLRISATTLLLLFAVDFSAGAVTFFGSVNPDPPGDGNVESQLVVGTSSDTNPEFRGYVRIDGGDQIEYESLVIGDDEGYLGEVIISGSLDANGLSRLTLEESGSSAIPTVQVGHEGVGTLTIENAGSLLFENIAADLSIGVETSGVGTMTVTGNFSLVRIPDSHFIGKEGFGRMEILDGGMVHNTDLTNTAFIGAETTGVGDVLVDGANSIWKIDDNLSIGVEGIGTLTLSNQGLLDIDRSGAITTIGPNGRLHLADGTLAGQSVILDGIMGGTGLVRGTVTSLVGGLIDVPHGDLLRFTDDVVNQGAIRIRNGEAVFLAGLTNLSAGAESSPGRITLEAGRIRFSEPLTNDGVLSVAEGVNHVHGEIAGGTGAVVVASNTVGTFYGPVNIGTGSLELLAGANALFLSDLSFEMGSLTTLHLDSGTASEAQIQVSGQASLAGGLVVEIDEENSPVGGDSFQLLSAAEGLTNTFEMVTLPTLSAGLTWNLDYGANSLILEVLTTVIGDFDLDGDADGADFLLWQRDPSVGALAEWASNYGASAPPRAASTPVPEPSACVLTLASVWLTIGRWRFAKQCPA